MKPMYTKVDTTKLYVHEKDNDYEFKLIRGDEVLTTGFDPASSRTEVTWRGRNGWVETADLGEAAMLEVYFLDVGQGDATFIVTPGRKTILIDGGKSLHALQFLNWKYRLDQDESPNITIDLVILSHADEDHIKGLTQVLDHEKITVKEVIHGGLTSYSSSAGKGTALGDKVTFDGQDYIVDRHSSLAELKDVLNDHLTDNFAKWKKALENVDTYQAVDFSTPEFDLGDPTIKLNILGPVLETIDGVDHSVFHSFGAKKYTINGHSVILHLQHGAVRYVFTGDVNDKAGKYLAAIDEVRDFLDAHVLKAPHHGSHEYDVDFLKAIHPQIIVVSSGEEPDYGHPRAPFLGMVGKLGRREPYLFSTELAATFKETNVESEDALVAALDLNDPGGLGEARKLWMKRLSGIINVRSDGTHLFAARRVTQGWQWNTYYFEAAGRDPG